MGGEANKVRDARLVTGRGQITFPEIAKHPTTGCDKKKQRENAIPTAEAGRDHEALVYYTCAIMRNSL